MQETPAGEGCKTRVYTYDEEGNRLSQAEYEPGTGGACATEHGSQTMHEYTTANDLADPGVGYESFGNITTLPAADGGGTETKAAFYVNNQAYTEAQGSTADAYTLDPADRTFQTITGTTTSTSHYDGPGNALSWTSQTGGGWTRDIPGIGGTLAAVQTSTTAPILQVHNLAGQTVAMIGDSPTETKLLSTHNPTEFGVSQPGEKAPEYGWLGQGLGSEFPSGSVVADGSTYIPLIGKPLQSAPIDVTYAPNEIGEFTDAQPPWAEENAVGISEKGVAEAEEARKAAEAAQDADPLLEFTLNPSNTEALYIAVSEVYVGHDGFAEVIAALVALGGAEGAIGILSSRQVQDNEIGEGTVQEWLWILSSGLENCVAQDQTTFAGGGKGCKVKFASIALPGDENAEDSANGVEEPEWTLLPAVWWCQYGECYPQNQGLIPNPR
jgi:hypothetical protein